MYGNVNRVPSFFPTMHTNVLVDQSLDSIQVALHTSQDEFFILSLYSRTVLVLFLNAAFTEYPAWIAAGA